MSNGLMASLISKVISVAGRQQDHRQFCLLFWSLLRISLFPVTCFLMIRKTATTRNNPINTNANGNNIFNKI